VSFEIYSRCSNDQRLYIWIRFGKGIYNAIFDNVEDSLSLGRLQCFDFQGVNNAPYRTAPVVSIDSATSLR
jgi:hypothetical protein